MDKNHMTIGKKQYSFREEELLQSSLKFYPENPRVYSLLVIDGVVPEQQEIEGLLTEMEHVKTLKQSIEANGGLIDPLIVRDGDFVVLEGNSRLAAYRMLVKKDPIKWGKVKCRILPSEISEDAVFTILGQYHIVGRQDWSPFEQAGYLWRRINQNDILPEVLAKEMGLSIGKTKKMVAVYDFMKEHDAVDPQKWSYYDEYLKSRSINQARADIPDLDNTIVKQIKTGEIPQAIDIRHKLEPITRVHNIKKRKKILKELVNEDLSLYECFEEAEMTGINTNILNCLETVRKKLNSLEEAKNLNNLTNDEINKCQYEIKKIMLRIKEIEKKLSQS